MHQTIVIAGSLLILGFFYGALYQFLTSRKYPDPPDWFTNITDSFFKNPTHPDRNRLEISTAPTPSVFPVFMAHWVTENDVFAPTKGLVPSIGWKSLIGLNFQAWKGTTHAN